MTDYILSEYQVIFGQHDDGFLTRSGAHLRVDRVTGCSPLQHHPMTEVVAEAIDETERKQRAHTQRKNKRFRQRYGSGGGETGGDDEQSDDDSSAAAALDEMLGGIKESDETDDTPTEDADEPWADGGVAADTRQRDWIVPPSQVKLLELTDDSRVRASVFPRTFRCAVCDHFTFVDPSSGDLDCPDCGRTLRQYPLVFACPRCAKVEQMQPNQVEVDTDHVGTIHCENCGSGHYHLHHDDSLSTAQFECTACDDTKSVRRICRECHIPSNDDGEDGAPSVMKPTPSDASSLISPMVKSALFINGEEISLPTLRGAHENGHDPYKWQAETLGTNLQNILADFWGLKSVFTVDSVNSLTAVYGYQTRVTAEGTDIGDGDRLTRAFDHDEDTKRAYVTRSEGRGLVFDFDTEVLHEVVTDLSNGAVPETYTALAQDELETVQDAAVKTLVDGAHDVVLIPLLHALEHALFEAAAHEIGMDDILGSKLLIADGAVVLYERENVGSGGLAQLTLDNEGRVLQKCLREAATSVTTCGQFCTEGCPSCIYTDDFDCRPYLPREVSRWVPPNALLRRDYAETFINADH